MPEPKSARGSKRAVEVSCVGWIDLLGYGAMLRNSRFDPTAAEAEAAIARLDRFQRLLSKHASKYSAVLVINDGAAVFRDLSPRAREVTYDFVRRVFEIHEEIKKDEISLGYPGARTVVAAGFRLRTSRDYKDRLLTGIGSTLIRKATNKEITIAHAVNTAITIKPYFARVPEVQANFGFAKAYLADTAGSAAGLAGARFFLDTALFHEPLPGWVDVEEMVPWSTEGMSAKFAVVRALLSDVAGRSRYKGVRDAYEIAEGLTASKEIIERLRALRIRRRPVT